MAGDAEVPFGEPAEGSGVPRLLNRELSWLDFNARVLALAENPAVPVLERAKFTAIFSSNLDEFFQVRVAGLKGQVAARVSKVAADGRTPGQQLIEISDRVTELVAHQEKVFLEQVVPDLAAAGIRLSSYAELDEDDRKYLDEVFESQIFPVLTPLAVDPGHPFPYISNLSLNLAVLVAEPDGDERRFARVKVPSILPRFVVMPDHERFVPLEAVIAAHLAALFPGMEIVEHVPFRVTRNADLTVEVEEDEADDLLSAVEMELRRRRFGRAVRLEIDASMSPEIRDLLQRELDLADDDVYEHVAPLDLKGLWSVYGLDRPELKDEPYKPVTPPELAVAAEEDETIFSVLARRDVLVHLPYDNFATTVQAFIEQAAVDPKVLAIKLTLYRTSGDSPIIKALIRAAERGKQVAALVELMARFDEQANIVWARKLEEAGVHVVYGLLGLKTHSKTCLVIRQEADGIHRYCHIGTGNYNPTTAKLYEDLGLLTSDPDLGNDLTHLFNYITGFAAETRYRKLVVAPHSMRSRLSDLIRGEAAAAPGTGRIVLKMNSLVDPVLIEDLYEASRAGVSVDLIVRGICCLRPGVPGLSENIRVRSLVGRYLEHSRVYAFANGAGPGQPAYYIGSADLMPRNLDRRVEALAPILAPDLQARLEQVLRTCLADDDLAWELGPDAVWRKVPAGGNDAQRQMQEVARARSRERIADRPGRR